MFFFFPNPEIMVLSHPKFTWDICMTDYSKRFQFHRTEGKFRWNRFALFQFYGNKNTSNTPKNNGTHRTNIEWMHTAHSMHEHQCSYTTSKSFILQNRKQSTGLFCIQNISTHSQRSELSVLFSNRKIAVYSVFTQKIAISEKHLDTGLHTVRSFSL